MNSDKAQHILVTAPHGLRRYKVSGILRDIQELRNFEKLASMKKMLQNIFRIFT